MHMFGIAVLHFMICEAVGCKQQGFRDGLQLFGVSFLHFMLFHQRWSADFKIQESEHITIYL